MSAVYLEDAAADRHVAGEGALLIDVTISDGGLGSLEAKADGTIITGSLMSHKIRRTIMQMNVNTLMRQTFLAFLPTRLAATNTASCF